MLLWSPTCLGPIQAIIIQNTVTREDFDTSVCPHNVQLFGT